MSTDTDTDTDTDAGTGAGTGARPEVTPDRPAVFSLRAELARQVRRRRTQVLLGFLVVLPVALVAAFVLGGDDEDEVDTASEGLSVVDLATTSGANFAVFTMFVSAGFLLVVTVALFCGDTVAGEASWGSLRYLLAAPVPRSRLMRSKLLVGLGSSVFAVVLLATVALVAGTVAFGWEPLATPFGDEIPAGEAVLRLAGIIGYLLVTLLVVASLAFMLSVLTDQPLGAVGGAVMLIVVSNILEFVEALGAVRVVLPTRYGLGWLGLLSSPVQTDDMVKGAISALAYSTVFLTLAWWRFLRKDVVS